MNVSITVGDLEVEVLVDLVLAEVDLKDATSGVKYVFGQLFRPINVVRIGGRLDVAKVFLQNNHLLFQEYDFRVVK